jgi:hypothetical protein
VDNSSFSDPQRRITVLDKQKVMRHNSNWYWMQRSGTAKADDQIQQPGLQRSPARK